MDPIQGKSENRGGKSEPIASTLTFGKRSVVYNGKTYRYTGLRLDVLGNSMYAFTNREGMLYDTIVTPDISDDENSMVFYHVTVTPYGKLDIQDPDSGEYIVRGGNKTTFEAEVEVSDGGSHKETTIPSSGKILENEGGIGEKVEKEISKTGTKAKSEADGGGKKGGGGAQQSPVDCTDTLTYEDGTYTGEWITDVPEELPASSDDDPDWNYYVTVAGLGKFPVRVSFVEA